LSGSDISYKKLSTSIDLTATVQLIYGRYCRYLIYIKEVGAAG